MNLIDAIKSGRPFRRPGWAWVCRPEGTNKFVFVEDESHADLGHPMDILADDWEILEPTVTITASQLADALASTMKWWESEQMRTFTKFDNYITSPARFGEELACRLGLGEKP